MRTKKLPFHWFLFSVALVTFGFSESFGDTSCGKAYRRPSESDVAWLLGCGNTASRDCSKSYGENRCSVAPCESACGLRNPACCCTECTHSRAKTAVARIVENEEPPRPPCAPAPVPTPAPDPIQAPPALVKKSPIRQTEHIETAEIVEEETIEDEAAAPSTPPKATVSPSIRRVSAQTPIAEEKPKPAVAKADVAVKKAASHTPPKLRPVPPEPPIEDESLPTSCSCGECVAGNSVSCSSRCTKPSSCKEQICEPSCSNDDFFHQFTTLHRTRTRHGSCCTCPCCCLIDVPDMLGDTGQIPSRFLTVRNQGNVFRQSQPTFLMGRVNLAEHFNLEAKNRIWFDYRHFSGAAQLYPFDGRSADVDRLTIGLEKKLTVCSSLELRVPVISQLSSRQPSGSENAELGNISLSYKYMVLRTRDYTFGGGLAVVCPTAESWRYSADGLTARMKNETVNLIPFVGVLWHPSADTFGQLLVQADLPISENKLSLGDRSVNVQEESLLRIGLQLGRWFYRNERGQHSCRLGGFLECNYTTTLDSGKNVGILSADQQSAVLFQSTKDCPQLVTVGAGVPVQFGKLSIVNGVVVPVTDDRCFSIAYNFSVNRRF